MANAHPAGVKRVGNSAETVYGGGEEDEEQEAWSPFLSFALLSTQTFLDYIASLSIY